MKNHVGSGDFEIVDIRHKEALDKLPKYLPNKRPYAYVQLHSSDICITIDCGCGASGHADGEFINFVLCTKCKKVFQIVPYLKIVEIDYEIAKFAKGFTEV